MKPAELKFRHWLGPLMAPYWNMTWHEDKEISPGVPDLHYVMKDQIGVGMHRNVVYPYRVGWLELKALEVSLNPTKRIEVQPSQHDYVRRFGSVMPIHFLVRIENNIILVDSKYHQELALAENLEDIEEIASGFWRSEVAIPHLIAHLRKVTLT